MSASKNFFIKETILKLLAAIGSEKEIKKYIAKFSSPDQRFAVIKVGGAVVKNDLDNLIASLVFLDQVGLKPVILHGAGPMLTERLDSRNIEYSFIEGQRVTSEKVRDVAVEVFIETNNTIVSALRSHGAQAEGLISNVFQCSQGDAALGLVGCIESIDEQQINALLESDTIPVITSLGEDSTGQVLNINADVATMELVMAISPYKVVFLSEIGGIYNESGALIKTINLVLEYQELMNQNWLHSGMKLKLEQIKTLLDRLPKTSSVSITQPINLPKELFTDSGSGTLVKYGYKVNQHSLPDQEIEATATSIVEASFQGKLVEGFFDHSEKFQIFMTTCERAVIVMSNEFKIPYMDKFGVIPDAKGEGLGSGVWLEMRKVFPQVFWRSRAGNPVNKYYSSICDGFQKHDDWHVFWIGITDYGDLENCIKLALNRPKTII